MLGRLPENSVSAVSVSYRWHSFDCFTALCGHVMEDKSWRHLPQQHIKAFRLGRDPHSQWYLTDCPSVSEFCKAKSLVWGNEINFVWFSFKKIKFSPWNCHQCIVPQDKVLCATPFPRNEKEKKKECDNV